MIILHFKIVSAAIFIKININNRKIRHNSQFYSPITSKCVPLKGGKCTGSYAKFGKKDRQLYNPSQDSSVQCSILKDLR